MLQVHVAEVDRAALKELGFSVRALGNTFQGAVVPGQSLLPGPRQRSGRWSQGRRLCGRPDLARLRASRAATSSSPPGTGTMPASFGPWPRRNAAPHAGQAEPGHPERQGGQVPLGRRVPLPGRSGRTTRITHRVQGVRRRARSSRRWSWTGRPSTSRSGPRSRASTSARVSSRPGFSIPVIRKNQAATNDQPEGRRVLRHRRAHQQRGASGGGEDPAPGRHPDPGRALPQHALPEQRDRAALPRHRQAREARRRRAPGLDAAAAHGPPTRTRRRTSRSSPGSRASATS